MTLVCATRTEARAARRLGASTAVVGVGVRGELPDGPLVSFGLAGALHDQLSCGEVLDATRVVDTTGKTLWQGGPLGVVGGREATIAAVERIVDDPAERRRLHEVTGADAVDMESGAIAESGRLAGCLRAVSDTPSRTLGSLADALSSDGRLFWRHLGRALMHPRQTGRALGDARRALRRLKEVGV